MTHVHVNFRQNDIYTLSLNANVADRTLVYNVIIFSDKKKTRVRKLRVLT